MKPKRQCGNCHYFKLTGEVVGDCNAPLPNSLRVLGMVRPNQQMLEKSGTDCPAHKLRSTRKAAKVEQGVQQ